MNIKGSTQFIKTILIITMLLIFHFTNATNLYFDGNGGDDSLDGLSPETAKKTFTAIQTIQLQPGDSILLKRGTTFLNDNIVLAGQAGSASFPIVISAYGEGIAPIIDNGTRFVYAIIIDGSEYIHVENIEMTGGNGGIFLTWIDQSIEFRHFVFRNLYIHDVYKASGFAFSLNTKGSKDPKRSEYTDVHIVNCRAEMIGRQFIKADGLRDVVIENNNFSHSGGPGIVFHHSVNVAILGNTVSNSGSRAHPIFYGRGSCAWLLNVRNVLVERNIFENAQGWLDSYGFHLDIGNTNVVIQHNLSRNNAGGFVQVLGKNKNTCYRYNISINDGWRVAGEYDFPEEKNIADGCVISIDGYTVNGDFEGPSNTYIYNNTVYVKDDNTACWNFRYTLKGLFIANNIFHITGSSKDRTGNRKPREPEGSFPQDVVFSNNVYLHSDNLPSNMMINDSHKIIGDVQFANAGGNSPEDYIPLNTELIENKSIEIQKVPNDPLGLHLGFDVETDFFGNPIMDTPDLGAVELSTYSYPYVHAGEDQSFTYIPDSALFSARFIDEVDIASAEWTQISGPACSLNQTDSTTMVIRDLSEGHYVFRYTVTNINADTAFDEVQVSVLCVECRTPIVSVGPDRIIQLPKDTVQLAASASVQLGAIESHEWTVLNGNNIILEQVNDTVALISGLYAGEFVFQYSATSSDGFNASGLIKMTVISAPDSIAKTINTIVIDGVRDTLWCAPAMPVNNLVKGFVNSTSSVTFAWDAVNFYVFVEAEDNFLMHDSGDEWWHDDAVEIFIDTDNSKKNEYDNNDFHFAFRWHWNPENNDIFETRHNATEGVLWKLLEVTGGYTLEVAFPWEVLNYTPTMGDNIGLEVRILNDDDGGTNDAIKALFGNSGEATPTPEQFGTFFLGKSCHKETGVWTTNHHESLMKVYPTITQTGIIHVEGVSTNELLYSITDLSGKLIEQKSITGDRINVSNLCPGVYFLAILNDFSTKNVFRIIKQ
jgi:parallel beta-helix repeat protein